MVVVVVVLSACSSSVACSRYLVFFQTDPYMMKVAISDQQQGPQSSQIVPSDDPSIGYEGYCVDLALHLAEIVHFDFHFRGVKDGAYGSENENGTWNGMIGELQRGVSFILILKACCTQHNERFLHI